MPPSSVCSRSPRNSRTRAPTRSASVTPPAWPTRCRCAPSSSRRGPALPGVELTAHFHNTRGQGLANVLAALEAGVDSFESSFGELGGCPVPAGATGNIASEDLVSMLEEMGIATGIDLAKLIEASRAAQQALGRPLGSHVLDGRAGRLASSLTAVSTVDDPSAALNAATERALAGGPERHRRQVRRAGQAAGAGADRAAARRGLVHRGRPAQPLGRRWRRRRRRRHRRRHGRRPPGRR